MSITKPATLAKKRSKYAWRRANNLCTGCGENPPRVGRLTCKPCAAAHSARNKRSQQRIVAGLRGLHICLHCRDREAMPGRQVCGACIEIQIDRQRERRNRWRLAGLCQRCGRDRDRKDRAYCARCRRANNRWGKRYQQRKAGRRRGSTVVVPQKAA